MTPSTIAAVTRETHDTVTLRIDAPLAFTPGQFAMIGLMLEGKPVRRSYSIASAPNGSYVELTIKAQEHGLFSRYAQTMQPGHEVNLYGPFGHHFLFDPAKHGQQHVVFIAGGSGIAPFRSMLQAAAAAGYKGKISLLYSVRTSKDIIFREELAQLAGLLDLDLTITITRPSADDRGWSGLQGRITPALVREKLGTVLQDKLFYICGPTPLVQSVQLLLHELHVPKEQVKTEKFGNIEA